MRNFPVKRANAEAVHWTKATFAAGLAMPLLLTAGGIATVVAFWQFTGLDAHVPFTWIYASFWLLTLLIVVPNVLIIRGWLRAAWLNPAVALLQLALLAGSWLMNTEPRPWFFSNRSPAPPLGTVALPQPSLSPLCIELLRDPRSHPRCQAAATTTAWR